MIRFISGLIFSSVFGLVIIGMFDPTVDKKTKVDGFIGSLIIYATPGLVLTTSGHQHMKRKKVVLKMAADLSIQEREINVHKICSLTGEKPMNVLQYLNKGKMKGAIPYEAKIV